MNNWLYIYDHFQNYFVLTRTKYPTNNRKLMLFDPQRGVLVKLATFWQCTYCNNPTKHIRDRVSYRLTITTALRYQITWQEWTNSRIHQVPTDKLTKKRHPSSDFSDWIIIYLWYHSKLLCLPRTKYSNENFKLFLHDQIRAFQVARTTFRQLSYCKNPTKAFTTRMLYRLSSKTTIRDPGTWQ